MLLETKTGGYLSDLKSQNNNKEIVRTFDKSQKILNILSIENGTSSLQSASF